MSNTMTNEEIEQNIKFNESKILELKQDMKLLKNEIQKLKILKVLSCVNNIIDSTGSVVEQIDVTKLRGEDKILSTDLTDVVNEAINKINQIELTSPPKLRRSKSFRPPKK
jgi:vacuolar-type H+-ATPase subunit I/STV1